MTAAAECNGFGYGVALVVAIAVGVPVFRAVLRDFQNIHAGQPRSLLERLQTWGYATLGFLGIPGWFVVLAALLAGAGAYRRSYRQSATASRAR